MNCISVVLINNVKDRKVVVLIISGFETLYGFHTSDKIVIIGGLGRYL